MMIKKLIFIFLLLTSTAYAQIPPVGIKDEGGAETKPVFTIDCVGAGIACTHSGTTGTLTVSGSGSATISGENQNVALSATVDTVNTLTGLTADVNPAGQWNVYIGVDDIKETQIDWGTGAGQVGTGDITEDTDNNFVTDAQLVVIGNTSGTNTGDNDQVGTVTNGSFCKGDGSAVQCATAANAGTDITADLEEEVTEGSLADSVIVSADIKDGEVTEADLNESSGSPSDNDFLTYNLAGTNFTWVSANAGTDITADLEEEITWGAGLSISTQTASTASGEADFLANGALTCGASTQGKMQVHTTPLQYCDNAATPALQYAAYGASDGDALAGDSASSFFDTGAIENTRGGTGGDSSSSTGIARVDTGTWSYSELSGEATTSGSNAVTIADSVAVSSWTITTPLFSGKADFDAGAVNDDDCTGEIGLMWFDDTDNAFEFCNADSGTPSTLGGGSGAFSDAGDPVVLNTTTKNVEIGDTGVTLDAKVQIGGDADEVQLIVEGHATQTDSIFIVQQDDETQVFTVDNDGTTTIGAGASGTVDFGTNSITDAIAGNLLTGSIDLPVQSAKLTGAYVTTAHTGVSAAVGASIDAGNGEWRLLFDDTTDEAAVWGFRMPNDYSSALTAKLIYSMASGTANKVEWEVSVMAITAGETTTVGFDTTNVGSATVPGTAGLTGEVSITLSNADSVAAGDLVYIYISTDSDDATNDNATGDRELLAVQLEYTR